jgi:hypothetical protein
LKWKARQNTPRPRDETERNRIDIRSVIFTGLPRNSHLFPQTYF